MNRFMNFRHYFFVALGVLCVTLLAMARPFFVPHETTEAVLNGSTVMAADRYHFKITSPVALFNSSYVVVEAGTVGLDKRSREAAQARGSMDEVVAGGDAELTLADARITLNLKTPEAPFEGTAASLLAPLAEALAGEKFSSLAIANSTIEVNAGQDSVEVLRDVEAHLNFADKEHLAVSGTFWLRGRKLEFNTAVDLGTAARSERRLPVQAKISGNLIEANLRGHLSAGNRARLIAPNSELKLTDLGEAARWLGLGWPARSAIQAFSGVGLIDWSAGILGFQDAVFRFDGNRATGAMTFNYQSPRPQVDSTLAFDRLDLTGLLAPDTGQSESLIETTVRHSANWLPLKLGLGGEGLAIPLLREVDADLRLSAESVQIGSLALGRSAAVVSLSDGKMQADLAELEFEGGGHGTVQFNLDSNVALPELGVRGRLQGFEIGNLTTALFGEPVLSGRGDVVIDVKAEGERYSDLIGSMSGRVEIRIPDSAALTIDLTKLIAQHSAGSTIGWEASAGLTTLSEFDIRLSIADGLARAETFSAKAGPQRLLGSGAIDVSAKSLDASLWIGVDKSAAGGETPIGDLVHFQGDWHAPGISVTRAPSRQAERPNGEGRSDGSAGRG